jgi:hypothetical protein
LGGRLTRGGGTSAQLQPDDLFSRCLVCNAKSWALRSPAWAAAQPNYGGVAVGVLERLQATGADLFQCTACGKLYWEGRHIDSAIRAFFGALLPEGITPETALLGRRAAAVATSPSNDDVQAQPL